MLAALGGGVLLAGVAAPAARAQSASQEAVMTRARPDFDPIGIEVFFDEKKPSAPITVFPKLDLHSGYDSNVFRESSNGKADMFSDISPSLRVTNTEQDLGLEAGLSATVRRNLQYQSNDFEDYDAYAQASYFFMEDASLTGQIGYSRAHEDRSDPNSTGPGENIVQYDRYRAILNSRNRFGDFEVNPQASYYYYNYMSQAGSNQDGRDHWEGEFRVRGGYEFLPGYTAFVEPGYNMRRYDLKVDSQGVTRDSWGWDLHAGLSYDVSAVTTAEVFVGYFQQKYEDPTLADAGGLTFGAKMTWNPLDEMTVNADVSRSVQESTLSGVSSTVATSYSLGVDYELTDSVMLTSTAGISTSAFQGSSRSDKSYTFGGGMVYLMNEFARARLNGTYETRDSNEVANNYDDLVVEGTLTLQY
ncbi:outer membrane beta-barrel protein [Tistlia consotensis]|nr:outer membrane beta-barrel protein [Tistlia consotensis]